LMPVNKFAAWGFTVVPSNYYLYEYK